MEIGAKLEKTGNFFVVFCCTMGQISVSCILIFFLHELLIMKNINWWLFPVEYWRFFLHSSKSPIPGRETWLPYHQLIHVVFIFMLSFYPCLLLQWYICTCMNNKGNNFAFLLSYNCTVWLVLYFINSIIIDGNAYIFSGF
jgi:hypothetical protein